MKSRIINHTKIFSLLFATLFATSCSDILNNPLEDKETGDDLTLLLLDPDFFDTKITVTLVDDQGEPFTEKETFIAFVGDQSSKIVDFNGELNEYYTTESGMLEVAVDPNLEISLSNPLLFSVIIGIEDYSWFAFPYEVELVKPGYAEVVITMFPVEALKSAQLNPGTEPFDVKFNGELVSSSNGWTVSDPDSRSGIFGWIYNRDKTYFSYLIYNGTTGGNLTAENLSMDPKLVKSHGFEKIFWSLLDNNRYVTEKNITVTDGLINVSGNANIFPFLLRYTDYTGLVRSNMEKCANGIDINVEEKYGQKGTAKFNYKLKRKKVLSVGIGYEYETIYEGKISGRAMPFNFSTGSFYYSNSSLSHNSFLDAFELLQYDSGVYLFIEGDEQYDIEPSEIRLDNFCGSTVDVVATPKSGLKPYKLVTSYVCENTKENTGPGVGAAPTISGSFREKGSNGKWSSINFNGGVAILQLVAGKTYEIKGNAWGSSAEFKFSTIESENGSVITEALSEIEELKDLSIMFSERTKATADDSFVGTIVRIIMTFNEGDCPL